MQTYHITWFETSDDFRSKGENFDGVNVITAIAAFEYKHPDVIFLSCVSMEVLNRRGMGEPARNINPQPFI